MTRADELRRKIADAMSEVRCMDAEIATIRAHQRDLREKATAWREELAEAEKEP